MEKVIILGGNEYKYNISFRMSYNFLKFRNRIANGFDFSKEDKKVVEEILNMQLKVQEKILNGEDIEEDLSILEDLSPEAIELLKKKSNSNSSLFNEEEIVEIVKTFTKISNEEEILDILDKEVEIEGFDNLIEKLINAISEVFTNAKDNSIQKEINKIELEKTVEK